MECIPYDGSKKTYCDPFLMRGIDEPTLMPPLSQNTIDLHPDVPNRVLGKAIHNLPGGINRRPEFSEWEA